LKTGKRLSLEDIAEKAGVSRSTVSRVINNDPNVKQKTREHVLRVIEEERFNPNIVARILVTGRTNVIGVVVPHEFYVFFNDPYYFPALLEGVDSAVKKRDYAMLVWLRQSGEDEEIFYRRILQNGLMDGVIIASASINNSLVSHLYDMGIPLAMVERPGSLDDKVNYVTIDNIEAARNAVTHLIRQGRRRIGIVTGALDNMDGSERLIGYQQALKEAGIAYDPAIVVVGDFQRKIAYEATKVLLSHHVDAIFACSDSMAQGVYDRLLEVKVRIPAEVAVVGFDDLQTAMNLQPALTTVRQPLRQKGEIATNILLDTIEGKIQTPQHVLLPSTLVIRQSCGTFETELDRR
jgi:DNA-binding LacI/PurR family transcriptional regulator